MTTRFSVDAMLAFELESRCFLWEYNDILPRVGVHSPLVGTPPAAEAPLRIDL